MVVPSWYGMASVKWLTEIRVTDRPYGGFFQTLDYSMWDRKNGRPELVPVTALQPKAIIVSPGLNGVVGAGQEAEEMQCNTVELDTSSPSPTLRFAPSFNVAVPFIDRHIAEGRAAKVAIRTIHGDVTYAQLAADVARCAGGLLRLGLRPGDRLLMVVNDCPAFFYLFWGAIKAGIVPVPLNTLLRRASYAFMIDDSGAAALAYSPELASEVEPGIELVVESFDRMVDAARSGRVRDSKTALSLLMAAGRPPLP